MHTASVIWSRAQVLNLTILLPSLVFPPLYFAWGGLSILFGIPAVLLFYPALLLTKFVFTNARPVNTWVAATACLPGLLLMTGICTALCAGVVCNSFEEPFEPGMLAFGAPALLATIIAAYMRRADIHEFIYPQLYDHYYSNDIS